MTAWETVDAVRLLLDEGREYHVSMKEIITKIRQSQLRLLKTYYMMGDERALRPFWVYHHERFYRSMDYIETGRMDVTPSNDRDRFFLYPGSLRVYLGFDPFNPALQPDETAYTANFVAYEKFMNYMTHNTGSYPKNFVWTYRKGLAEFSLTQLFISGDPYGRERHPWQRNTVWGKLCYLGKPLDFYVDESGLNQHQPLELPEEYHFECVALAAEMLNDIDVGELERGQRAYPQAGQIVDIEGLP